MFILFPDHFADRNRGNLPQFVAWWSQFVPETPTIYQTEDQIDYFAEIHLDYNLTEENLRRLLRWKDPHYLTQLIRVHGQMQNNPRVVAVLAAINDINAFRHHQIDDAQFARIADGIFPTGPVFRALLFHIARPLEYPIWDKNVCRVHSLLTGVPNETNWAHYLQYRDWFNDLLVHAGIQQIAANLNQVKALDSALMAFGIFIGKYTPAAG